MVVKKAAKGHFSAEGNSWFYLQTQVDQVKGRKSIFPFGILLCQDFYGSNQNEVTFGLCKEKLQQWGAAPSHLPVKHLPACPHCHGAGSWLFHFLSSNAAPFLTFIIVNYISWILYELPEVSSELMINHISLSCISVSYFTIEDCSCQGSADPSWMSEFGTFRELVSFGGLFFHFTFQKVFNKKRKTTLIYPVMFSKEAFRVLISNRIRKDVPKAAFSK